MLNNNIKAMVEGNKVNNLKMFVKAEEKSKISVTLKPDMNFSDYTMDCIQHLMRRCLKNF